MKLPKHVNNGNCPRCDIIFDRYPGFNAYLRQWFKDLQAQHKDAHISCAGRGKKEQEEYFLKGTSKARYGQSAHNYNAAIDLFRLEQNGASWARNWFENIVLPAVKAHIDRLNWYGLPGSPYFELPHIELRDWKKLSLKLVE